MFTWKIAYQIEPVNWAPDINDLEWHKNSYLILLKLNCSYVTSPRRSTKCADIETDESNVQIPAMEMNIVWITINQSRPGAAKASANQPIKWKILSKRKFELK